MRRFVLFLLSLVLICGGCSTRKAIQESSEIDVMIGQMIMVGFRGLEAGPDSLIARDILEAGIGGVILFNKDCALNSTVRNISSPAQLKQLTSSLSSYSRIPLFIAIDQEGGMVSRLTSEMGFIETPSAAELGNSGDVEAAYLAGLRTGRTLADVGINMNFAPVVDVNRNAANPVIAALQRSFSDNPEIVSKFAGAFADGLHASGILSCLKHFPGHGSSQADSHKGFTNVTSSWKSDELYPFSTLIREGKADMIMTAHIFNEKLDRKYPATLSRRVLTGLLRRKLGFEGLIVTDDMQMAAVSSLYGFKEALRMAVNAGADILLFGNNLIYEPRLGRKAFSTLKELVRKGKISERRIRESYERIMKAKSRLRSVKP